MRITFSLLFLFLSSFLPAQHLSQTEARQLIPGAEHIWLKAHNKLPHYIKFASDKLIRRVQFDGFVKEKMSWDLNTDGWQFLREENDQLGHHHERFQQTYQGYPVEGSMINIHAKQGWVYAMNGDFFDLKNISLTVSLTEKRALQAALDHIGANAYKWQILREESLLQDLKRGTTKEAGPYTYYPKGELVVAPVGGDFEKGEYRLAWKFDIFAHAPLSRDYVFVDAANGKVLFKLNRIHTVDVVGTAMTGYNGTRSIVTDSVAVGQYRLRETGRGNGIYTWNLGNTTDPANQVDFVDADNIWNNVNASLDQFATDAHWGAEMTYDYFLLRHGRNSIDGNGFAINSQVHYGAFTTQNASWNGSTMNYYDGNGRPFTALDIAGHEISHGLTTYSANLIYQNESGALNESFSDVFGKAIERWARPGNFSWNIGQDMNFVIRDMADPNRFNNPRNYLGTDWYIGTGDNGGVHTNSGVQNHWFYLLCEGGTGVNDFGDAYNVSKIGFDTAANIAFRNLTVYLTNNSSYEDAAFYAIESAKDLYGNCGRIHEVVQNAWHAVGIGKPFSSVPISDFGAQKVEICSVPYIVNFKEKTLGGSSYMWDFGDGNSSSLANPNHTYAAPGVYTVSLSINGYCGGADSLTKNAFIQVNQAPAAPLVAHSSVTVNCLGDAILRASAPNNLLWTDQADQLLSKEDSVVISGVVGSSTYYVQHVVENASIQAGPVDGDSVGPGTFFNNQLPQGLLFDVLDEIRIKSVLINASAAGTRTIEIKQGSKLIESVTASFPLGKSRINLNTILSPGSYEILGTNMGMFCNNGAGISYPYTVQDLISINTSTAGNTFYCFFYDWEVATFCKSPKVPVHVQAVVPTPVLSQSQLSLGCGDAATIIASGSNGVSWYDSFNKLVYRGDSLRLNGVKSSTTYFAQTELEGPLQKVGPQNSNSLGAGRYFSDAAQRGVFFDVLAPLRFHSVWVDAGSSGSRIINIEDASGSLLHSLNVNIPSGQSRVNLDVELEPGSYFIWGTNMDLFRNRANGGNFYPFDLNNLISITGSDVGPSFYYYFYDWEVSTLCKSPQVPLNITVSPLAVPTVSGGDSVCYDASATLQASTGGASWYDANGNFLAAGSSYTTAALRASTTYFVQGESAEALQQVGPLDAAAVGNGGYHNSPSQAWLEFDVQQPIRLNSVWVDAATAGVRNILIQDGLGNLLQTVSVSIAAGANRLPLGITLGAGSYRIGGSNMNLFRNSVGGNFPYALSKLVSITGTSNGPGFYFYFYDWEVQTQACASPQIAVPLAVRAAFPADFSFTQNGPLLNFSDKSPAAQAWQWDFGDGNNSPDQNPSHLYDASGTYIVTLTITHGPCTSVHSDTVVVEPGVGIGELATKSFQLFPNPGNGQLRVRAEALRSSEMQVIVYDLTGRQVYASAMREAIFFEEKIDISHLPSGNYFVKLRVQDAQIIRKYVLIK